MNRIIVALLWLWVMILIIGTPIAIVLNMLEIIQNTTVGYFILGWIFCTVSAIAIVLPHFL